MMTAESMMSKRPVLTITLVLFILLNLFMLFILMSSKRTVRLVPLT